MTAVIPHDASLPAGCELTATGLRLPPGLPFGAWKELLRDLLILRKQKECELDLTTWWLADCIIYGKAEYGETYVQAIEDTGLSYQRLANIVWVGSKFSAMRKFVQTLSFEHHSKVAALPLPKATKLLSKAKKEGWSSRELYEQRLDQKARDDGRDPAVARAERALERAREAVEGLELEVQIELVWRLLLEPLELIDEYS